jgi:hypothetical protein
MVNPLLHGEDSIKFELCMSTWKVECLVKLLKQVIYRTTDLGFGLLLRNLFARSLRDLQNNPFGFWFIIAKFIRKVTPLSKRHIFSIEWELCSYLKFVLVIG